MAGWVRIEHPDGRSYVIDPSNFHGGYSGGSYAARGFRIVSDENGFSHDARPDDPAATSRPGGAGVMGETDARIEELHDMVEDLAGNLEDAADTIERTLQAIIPGQLSRDAEAYRDIVRKARALL